MFFINNNLSYLGSLDREVLVHLFLLYKENIDQSRINLTRENKPGRPGKPGVPSEKKRLEIEFYHYRWYEYLPNPLAPGKPGDPSRPGRPRYKTSLFFFTVQRY
jgi:hypothetical protein